MSTASLTTYLPNRPSPILFRLACLYILTLPFFGFSFFNVGGRGLARPDWLFGLLLTAMFTLASSSGRVKLAPSPVNLFMVFYLFSGILSAIMVMGANNSSQFLDFFTKALQLMLVTPTFFVISSLPIGEHENKSLLKTWLFTGVVISLHAIYQLIAQVLHLPFASFTLTNPSISVTHGVQSARTLFGYTQPTSIFQEPSYLGAFLGPCLILTTVFVLERRSADLLFKRIWLNWLCLLVLAAAVLLSNSQAMLAGLTFTLLFMFGRGLVNRLRILRFVLTAVGLVLLLTFLLQVLGIDFLTAFTYRFQYLIINILEPKHSAQVTSFADRSLGLQIGLEVWRQHPLLGVGLGNMAYYNPLNRAATNNGWAQLLVEQGVVGLVALLLVFGVLFWQLSWLLALQRQKTFWRTALIAMLCIVFLTLFDGLFTFNWTDPLRVFVLAMANLVYIQANAHTQRQRRTSQRSPLPAERI